MKKIKGSWASYEAQPGEDAETDLAELAGELMNWGNIPSKINDVRAYELMLLAKAYLKLLKKKGAKDEA